VEVEEKPVLYHVSCSSYSSLPAPLHIVDSTWMIPSRLGTSEMDRAVVSFRISSLHTETDKKVTDAATDKAVVNVNVILRS
jgi:hypothetical protein